MPNDPHEPVTQRWFAWMAPAAGRGAERMPPADRGGHRRRARRPAGDGRRRRPPAHGAARRRLRAAARAAGRVGAGPDDDRLPRRRHHHAAQLRRAGRHGRSLLCGALHLLRSGPGPRAAPQKYGGLTLTTDRCSSTLLIGGDANLATGKLYAVQVTRDGSGHINGFSGAATVFADAPFNDGGVAYAPNGALLLSRWPSNELQQTRPGSRLADKVVDLEPLGVAYASASLNFVPASVAPGGALKAVSWSGGQWYTVALVPDGQGTFDVPSVSHVLTLPGGPEGFVYVGAGSPLFPTHSLLVSEWSADQNRHLRGRRQR